MPWKAKLLGSNLFFLSIGKYSVEIKLSAYDSSYLFSA